MILLSLRAAQLIELALAIVHLIPVVTLLAWHQRFVRSFKVAVGSVKLAHSFFLFLDVG